MENLLSQNVRRLCKARNLQLKDLASAMAVDPATLTRALNGNCRLSTINKIADALGVSLKTLFEHVDDVEGYIKIGGMIHRFNSKQELENILMKYEQIHNPLKDFHI